MQRKPPASICLNCLIRCFTGIIHHCLGPLVYPHITITCKRMSTILTLVGCGRFHAYPNFQGYTMRAIIPSGTLAMSSGISVGSCNTNLHIVIVCSAIIRTRIFRQHFCRSGVLATNQVYLRGFIIFQFLRRLSEHVFKKWGSRGLLQAGGSG